MLAHKGLQFVASAVLHQLLPLVLLGSNLCIALFHVVDVFALRIAHHEVLVEGRIRASLQEFVGTLLALLVGVVVVVVKTADEESQQDYQTYEHAACAGTLWSSCRSLRTLWTLPLSLPVREGCRMIRRLHILISRGNSSLPIREGGGRVSIFPTRFDGGGCFFFHACFDREGNLIQAFLLTLGFSLCPLGVDGASALRTCLSHRRDVMAAFRTFYHCHNYSI